MKKSIILILFAVLTVSWAAYAHSKEQPRPKLLSQSQPSADNRYARPDDQINRGSPQTCTIYPLGSWTFEGCSPMGWTYVDRTAQIGNFWHVDDFAALGGGSNGCLVPIQGLQSMWCGARPNVADPLLCTYAALPGYGNGWNQVFESRHWEVTGDVTLEFDATYDTEAGYDIVHVEYSVDYESTWNELGLFSGAYCDTSASYTIPAAEIPNGVIWFRFCFKSDGAWSDEDGLWNTDGAIILDNLLVRDLGTLNHLEDFEDEAVGDHQTNETAPYWQGTPAEAFGNHAGLFNGATMPQEGSPQNTSCLWAFTNGSTDLCDQYPGVFVVPYGRTTEGCCNDQCESYIHNEIQSPLVDWDAGGTIPDDVWQLRLEFDVYADLPLDNLVFYTWSIRSISALGVPGQWRDRNTVYYDQGLGPHWKHEVLEIGDLVDPGAEYVQVALGVVDMYEQYEPFYGYSGCHSHAPLFDNVSLARIPPFGPWWSVNQIDLFQDNFPSDGSLTGTVEVIRAQNIDVPPAIQHGQELIASAYDPYYGLAEHEPLKPAVYLCVKCTNPSKTGAAIAHSSGFWPVVTSYAAPFTPPEGWTVVLMRKFDDDMFDVDLNDALFTPPDRIDYFLAAVDARPAGEGGPRVSYWSEFTGMTGSLDDVVAEPMEMQCLPTPGVSILYVDHADGTDAQDMIEYDLAIMEPPLAWDRFDVRVPAQMQGNSLGGCAVSEQIVDVYRYIVWNSGDFTSGTIGNGGTDPSPDVQLLLDFLDESSLWEPGLYLSGDAIATDLEPYAGASTYLDYELLTANHREAPYSYSSMPSIRGLVPDTFFKYPNGSAHTALLDAGYPISDEFDILAPLGISKIQMYYSDHFQTGHGAIISQEAENDKGTMARVVLAGFSYHHLVDDLSIIVPTSKGGPDRSGGREYYRFEHLAAILNFLRMDVECVGAEDRIPLENSLSQNHPNPFNPSTTIRFAIKEDGHVRLNIYDVSGRIVKTLVDEPRKADFYSVFWNGLDDDGAPVASGVYFCKLVAGTFVETRKMVLVR